MIRGLFLTVDPVLGHCVRVHHSAGDAAPLLPEAIYKSLGGKPRCEDLPRRSSADLPSCWAA